MSRIRADQITNKAATGAVNITHGVEVTGFATATRFVGSAAGLTGDYPGNASGISDTASINSTGIATFASGNYTGNLNVGGTLTYEDVTNQDVIGLSTFRAGIKVSTGGVDITAGGLNVTAGISTIGAGASVNGAYKSNISTVSGTTIDCSLGNYFTKTITGATTFAFSNVPTYCVYIMTVEVTCNGSNSIAWPAAVKFPADTAPTLTDGKTQLFTFITDDGGTRWRANSSVDYTN